MTDYGTSDTSTTTLGANQFPIADVYVPNVGLRATEGGPASTDGTGKPSAPVSMYVKDGGNVAQGATTDTAATTDTGTFTLMALFKRLLTKFVYDSTDRLKVSLYGKSSAAGDTALLLDSLGQMTTEQFIQYQIAQGKGYTVSSGKQTNAAGGNFPMEFLNSSVAKTFLIYSVTVSSVGAATTNQINTITADAGWTGNTTPTILNQRAGGAASSISTVVYNTTTQTVGAASTLLATNTQGANATTELLAGSGSYYILPPSTANGIVVWTIPTGASAWAITIKWVEF